MAQIQFMAFVHEVKSPTKVTVVENHRKKDENGKYYTASRTFRSIKPGYNYKQDLGHLTKGDLINVTGREITEEWEYEGKKYRDLVVQVDEVIVERSDGLPQSQNNTNPGTNVTPKEIPLDLEAPF